jgi:glycosyltransferase involved in cell wall biosynthesis
MVHGPGQEHDGSGELGSLRKQRYKDMTDLHAAWPRISVVTPSYNQGCFLEQTIRSVLDQQYPNLEYFIIDGGSTDDSTSIIRRYESHLASWISERDAGQSDAINKGFQRCTGDLVAWLNSDDFYLPGALHTAAAVYLRHPQASFYLGDGLRVDRDGKPFAAYFPGGQVRFHRAALVWGVNTILQPATFIQRRYLDQVGYLDINLHYGMDSDLWLKLSALAGPQIIPEMLAASREYPDAKTFTGSFGRIEELRRISEKHSGCPHTPGTLCYFADSLRRMVLERPDVFPPQFVGDIDVFWAALARLFWRFGASGADLYPLATPSAANVDTLTTGNAAAVTTSGSGGPQGQPTPALAPSGTLTRAVKRLRRVGGNMVRMLKGADTVS